MESTLTSKGQTTIPKDLRDRLTMKAGDRITFALLPDGTVLMRVKNKSVMALMLGLRTNVLVRFLVADDPAQFERAQQLIRRESRKDDSHLRAMFGNRGQTIASA